MNDKFAERLLALNDHLKQKGDTQGLILLSDAVTELHKFGRETIDHIKEMRKMLPFKHTDRRSEFRETTQMTSGLISSPKFSDVPIA